MRNDGRVAGAMRPAERAGGTRAPRRREDGTRHAVA
jgi:hypothetical protein